MFVKSIKKSGKGKYTVLIDGKEYTFFESIIVEYRFVEGHETSDEEIAEAIASNELEEYYSKAVNYLIRYGKSEAEVKTYLRNKNVSYSGIKAIIERLKKNRILVDDKLIDALIDSYMRSGNGRNMIRYKLEGKGFKKDSIESHLNALDEEAYRDALENLYKKIKNKYAKDEERIQKMKIKRYLLQRGYTNSDIELLEL